VSGEGQTVQRGSNPRRLPGHDDNDLRIRHAPENENIKDMRLNSNAAQSSTITFSNEGHQINRNKLEKTMKTLAIIFAIAIFVLMLCFPEVRI